MHSILLPITLCSLDIIIETAMGQESNIQLDENNEYANAVTSFLRTNFQRVANVLLWNDAIWALTADGRQQARDVKVLHSFTRNIIQKKWKEHQSGQANRNEFYSPDAGRKRKAFLGISGEK